MENHMTDKELLKSTNKDLFRKGEINPNWYLYGQRIHPERQIKMRMHRSSEMEILAQQFFAEISRDSELLAKRANILLDWWRQRRLLSLDYLP